MFISVSRDKVFEKKILSRRKHQAPQERPSLSTCSTLPQSDSSQLLLHTKLRPRKKTKSIASQLELLEENTSSSNCKDSHFVPKPVTGGKFYAEKRKPSISAYSCSSADKPHTSIRQQSDQILAFPGNEKHLQVLCIETQKKTRLLSLEDCRCQINDADFLQLHYDGRIISG